MNIKRAFLLIPLLFLLLFHTVPVTAQAHFYKHMEGQLGEGISLKADIIRIDAKLSGYYYYYFLDTLQHSNYGTHYGKSLPIYGTINPDNSLEFSEYSEDVSGAKFRGKYADGAITGEWVSSQGNKTMPFQLQETYPEGSIAFYVYHLSDKGPLLDNKKEPAASLDLTLLLPKPYSKAATVDSVEALIYREFFGLDSTGADPEISMKQNRDLFFKNYRKANIDLYQEGAASFNWEKSKAVRILYNENQFLSLEFYDYGFTGGAHGLTISKFFVINLEDGHSVTLDEIFRKDFKNDLRDILNDQLRLQFEIPDNKDLRDAGFWVEAVDPSTNFYLNKDGIAFYYNQYEIAPFSMGPVQVFIPYSRMRWIMNTDGEVYKTVMNN